jgi:precorrin-6B methylase 2
MMKQLMARVFAAADYEQVTVFLGYLRASGWLRSLRLKKPVGPDGEPVPWYSYPCIHFLQERLGRLNGDLKVFEFGSGNSTIWWAARASTVVAVEDDEQWYSYLNRTLPTNVTYKLAHTAEEYVGALKAEPVPFDVIVVDGSYRQQCIVEAAGRLTEPGVLIVDNSDWPDLVGPVRQLEVSGFRSIQFYGLGPVNGYPWGTSILYRKDNWLGI